MCACVAELSLDSKNHGADESNVIFVHACSHNLRASLHGYNNSLAVWIEGYQRRMVIINLLLIGH